MIVEEGENSYSHHDLNPDEEDSEIDDETDEVDLTYPLSIN